MRVAIVTESFLPQVNGVTNSVVRVCEYLTARRHDVLIVAPGPGPRSCAGARVVRTPSLPAPGYRGFRLACPWPGLSDALRSFAPDVVHLASPAVLGAQAAQQAHRIGLPIVAVYQTDLAGFAVRYGLRGAQRLAWRWLRRVHGFAGRTLAPSRQAVDDLRRNGVPRVMRWGRGVDLHQFDPRHRDEALRRELAPNGEVLVGYVGRLAAEKQLELLRGLDRAPGMRLVFVGDGPQRASLTRAMPDAAWLGLRAGAELGRIMASLDVFVHPGRHETFCQAAQEALASGLPVVGARAGGLLDLITPGQTGGWFEPGSATALHHEVRALVADADRRRAMSTQARASVRGRSWTAIGRELEQHYAQVCAQR